MDPVIRKAIEDAVAKHGSLRKASMAYGHVGTTLSAAISSGTFGAKALEILNVRKTVKYERIDGSGWQCVKCGSPEEIQCGCGPSRRLTLRRERIE